MRQAVIVGAILLSACEPVDVGMDEGICGPIVLPLEVVPLVGVDRALLNDAAAIWDVADVPLVSVSAHRGEECYWGCRGVATVQYAELPSGVLGDTARSVSPTGEVLACEIRLAAAWDGTPEVLAHEIGHCLGLGHDVSDDSIMHSPVRPWATPMPRDVEAILRGCDGQP